MSPTPTSEANSFLGPVLDRNQLLALRNASLIQRLSSSLPEPLSSTDTKIVTSTVITHALSLLKSIHAAAAASPSQTTEKLVNATDSRTITCLLDLLVLEGIYPSLSTGVGIPIERRARNFVLPATRKRVQEVGENRNVELLGKVVDGLIGVTEGEGTAIGVGGTVKERCLVDVLAGCGELAFVERGETAEGWKERWRVLVNRTPTPALLPSLLSLLHPLTPPPFRQQLTSTLSTLPLRPQAIRHILQLFLSTISDSALSINALTNASRIICAVPATITPETYFANVCRQLLECLDGKDAGLARAAGFVIAELLGKKGKVEGVVEREIVEPVVSGLSPSWAKADETANLVQGEHRRASAILLAPENPPPKRSLIQEIVDHQPSLVSQIDDIQIQNKPLVSEKYLSCALHRLSILLSSHPSPSVPQRLVSPILLPLWALISYAKKTSRSMWYSRALALLKSYIKTTVTTDGVDEGPVLGRLQKGLLFTGGPIWEFGPGADGGIEIRPRYNGESLGMAIIEARVEEFLALIDEGGVPEGSLNTFFLSILRVWLGRRNREEEEDPVRMFTTLKILQEMLSRHSGVLAKAPTQTLEIVSGVLGEFVDYCESLKSQEKEMVNPTLGGLGKIVQRISLPGVPQKQQDRRKFMDGEGGEEEVVVDEETERNETVMMALSLLSVLISQPGTKLTEEDERLIQTLHPPLQYISTSPCIDSDLSSLAVNIASLLALYEPTAGASADISLAEVEKESYVLALSYLRDPLIPVRAHGLHLLRLLIMARAAVVDVVGTMRLLIGMLKDGDSFVYLNVVKCLGALTERHSKMVTRMLVESYVDDDGLEAGGEGGKLGLDERLRIGEALLVTVQRLGGALVGETANAICEGILGIISRRRTRKDRDGASEEEFGSDPEDEEGGKDMGEDEDPQAQQRKKAERAHKARIIKGWQPKNSTEDLRIRTSALSILGAAVETNAPGLGPRNLTEALSTSLLILTLETAAEKAILRRAAVVCIGSVLKSLVGLGDDEKEFEGKAWRATVWDVLKNRIGEVRRVLGYVRGSDSDGLVREQAGVVAENLEAVVERWMVGGSAGGGAIMGGFGGLKVL